MPLYSYGHDEYHSGIEKSKKELLDFIDRKIEMIYFSLQNIHDDKEYLEITGKIHIYHQLKIHLENEFQKSTWNYPMGFTYPWTYPTLVAEILALQGDVVDV